MRRILYRRHKSGNIAILAKIESVWTENYGLTPEKPSSGKRLLDFTCAPEYLSR
jgi:hypothetical protein